MVFTTFLLKGMVETETNAYSIIRFSQFIDSRLTGNEVASPRCFDELFLRKIKVNSYLLNSFANTELEITRILNFENPNKPMKLSRLYTHPSFSRFVHRCCDSFSLKGAIGY